MSEFSRVVSKVVPSISLAEVQQVKDPAIRSLFRSISDMMAVRNGDRGNGDDAFLTMADFKAGGYTARAVANALARPIAESMVNDMILLAEQLEQRILNLPEWRSLFARLNLIDAPDTSPGSLAFNVLQEARARGAAITQVNTLINTTAESFAQQVNLLTAASNQNAAAISEEAFARTTSATAEAGRLTLFIANTGENFAGVLSDLSVKTNNDNALASAVNTLWATVGNNTALVSSGTQIAVNNTGSTTTKFDQLQAVTENAITGLVDKAAILRNEFNVSNSIVSGMSGNWSVKLDLNGYVAGLSLNASVDTAGRSRSSMLFLADIFAVGAPGRPDIVPFAIDTQTGLVAIRGDLVARGSITSPKIAARTITADNIAVGAITAESGVIADLAVDTLQIAGNAVTIPKVVSRFDSAYGSGSTFVNVLGTTITLKQPGTLLAIVTCSQASRDGDNSWNMKLQINGNTVAEAGGASPLDAVALSGALTLPAGTHTVALMRQSGGRIWAVNRNMTLFGVMR
ncbi:MAG: hypothetical protein WKF61_01045 [Luteimonas sp.]